MHIPLFARLYLPFVIAVHGDMCMHVGGRCARVEFLVCRTPLANNADADSDLNQIKSKFIYITL